MKNTKTVEKKNVEQQVADMAATRGHAINLRPGGPMGDRRLKRLKTRATRKADAINNG